MVFRGTCFACFDFLLMKKKGPLRASVYVLKRPWDRPLKGRSNNCDTKCTA